MLNRNNSLKRNNRSNFRVVEDEIIFLEESAVKVHATLRIEKREIWANVEDRFNASPKFINIASFESLRMHFKRTLTSFWRKDNFNKVRSGFPATFSAHEARLSEILTAIVDLKEG